MNKWKTISDIRREYGHLSVCEKSAPASPIEQFELWFAEVLQSEKSDPTAMVLSTVNEEGHPDSRVVLLKGLENGAFIFYTNYQSAKAIQLQKTPYAALNFYWPQMARQVRIQGHVRQTTSEQSDAYFTSRPLSSQLSALVSPQSRPIGSRAELEEKINQLLTKYQEHIARPDYWGGYAVLPESFEFWQGRDNRLHDRIHYYRKKDQWVHRRLAP